MEQNIILTKQSNEEQIKGYFEAILKLSQSDDKFPTNLDEVWMLVYPRKDHAVRSLEENFIEGVDYEVFLKNGENSKGGRPSNEYKLSVSCLEYFIARKVRSVFDVYRQVFHKSVEVVKQLNNQKHQITPTLSIEDQFKMISLACKELKVGKAEKRAALNNLLMQNGLPQITFSVEASGKHASSAEDLLSINGLGIKSKRLFSLMKVYGYVETRKRPTTTTKCGYNEYSVLSEEGQKWGYNEPSRFVANKYDIRLYVDKFPSLLNELGLK